MPTYEYECENCGYRFEVFQSITDEPLKECKKCKGSVKRLIGTGTLIVSKGSNSPSSSSCSTCSATTCSTCRR